MNKIKKVKYIMCWLVVSAREKSNAEEKSVSFGVGVSHL